MRGDRAERVAAPAQHPAVQVDAGDGAGVDGDDVRAVAVLQADPAGHGEPDHDQVEAAGVGVADADVDVELGALDHERLGAW